MTFTRKHATPSVEAKALLNAATARPAVAPQPELALPPAVPTPTPPAAGMTEAEIGFEAVWFEEIDDFGFDMATSPYPRRVTPFALFGLANPAADVEAKLDRATKLSTWFRNKQHAPWDWIDGQRNAIGFSVARMAREAVGSASWWACYQQRTAIIEEFESELDSRIRKYLVQSTKQQEGVAARAAAVG